GKKLWEYDPQAGHALNIDGRERHYKVNRGVAYWENGSDRRILYGTYDARLIALDARTGKPYLDFGDNGAINLRVGAAEQFPDAVYAVTSPPAIFRDLVITGAEAPEWPGHGPSGVVR